MTILAADNFSNYGRTLTNGWNTAHDGQAWQILSGGAIRWSIVGNKGQITGSTSSQVGALGSGTSVDQDIRCRVSVSATGDSVAMSGRMTASNTAYRARIQNNLFTLLVTVAGTATTLQQVSFPTTPGTLYQIHLRLRGSQQFANAWVDGTIEPSGWMCTGNDTQITVAGQYGVVTGLAAATDIATYDQFVATNPTQVTDSPYGLTIGLTNKNPPTANFAHWADLFGDMRALGVSWLRFQLDWQLIQLNQNDPVANFAWAPLDDAINRCNEAGIYISHALRGAPTWALDPAQGAVQTSTLPSYAMNASMAATFAGQLASRYNGSNGHGFLNAYELGNEQWNITFIPSNKGYVGLYNSPYPEYNGLSGVSLNVQPARDPHFFVPILKQVSPAIRAASPSTKIGMCAIWWLQYPNVADFMADLYREVSNAASLFDYANFHFYSNGADPSVAGSGTNYQPSFQQTWAAIQTAMHNAGDTSKPIWCTEFGWGTNTNGGGQVDCDINTQATRYSYVLSSAQSSGGAVAKMFFFELNYKTQDINGNPLTDTASIVQWDVPTQSYKQLPAYTTFQQFAQQYPTWSAVPPANARVLLPPISRRSGVVDTVFVNRRDGAIPVDRRRG